MERQQSSAVLRRGEHLPLLGAASEDTSAQALAAFAAGFTARDYTLEEFSRVAAECGVELPTERPSRVVRKHAMGRGPCSADMRRLLLSARVRRGFARDRRRPAV